MIPPLSWIFRCIARRYDNRLLYARHEAWKELRPPWWVRLARWFFGSPFTGEGSPDALFWRWVQRVGLILLYLAFLWVLYESYWAWDIFS